LKDDHEDGKGEGEEESDAKWIAGREK